VDPGTRLWNARNTGQHLAGILREPTGKLSHVLDGETELDRVRGEIEPMDGEKKALAKLGRFRDRESGGVGIGPHRRRRRRRLADQDRERGRTGLFLAGTAPTVLLWAAVLFFPARYALKRGAQPLSDDAAQPEWGQVESADTRHEIRDHPFGRRYLHGPPVHQHRQGFGKCEHPLGIRRAPDLVDHRDAMCQNATGALRLRAKSGKDGPPCPNYRASAVNFATIDSTDDIWSGRPRRTTADGWPRGKTRWMLKVERISVTSGAVSVCCAT
jgi:hypothetical protein